MFVLLLLYHFESEKEKKRLINYYENKLEKKKPASKADLDSMFKKK